MRTNDVVSASTVFRSIMPFAVLAMLISGCPPGGEMPGRFGIYVSDLKGENMKALATDSYREINHARVSPDHKWITFTRYNRRGLNGLAEETGGYQKTEIMLMKADGTNIASLTNVRDFPMAANGYWTPDGRSVVFVGKSSADRYSRLYMVDVATKKVRELPTPSNENLADPHIVDNRMVFTLREEKPITRNIICFMKLDGSGFRRLTSPKVHLKRAPEPPEGDFDPKLSPDGTEVAFMRHDGKSWHLVVHNLNTGKERDLSLNMDGGDADAVPEWSSDGQLLSFWHVNLRNPQKSGLYYARPDGSGRKRIPLPPGYFYTMQAFFPGEKSSGGMRIIFSAKKL